MADPTPRDRQPRRGDLNGEVPTRPHLPPEGWVYRRSHKPPLNCSWCDQKLMEFRGLWLCPACDHSAMTCGRRP